MLRSLREELANSDSYDYGLLAISDLEQSRPNILSVLKKYRAGKGDIIHVVHDTPQGAPLFTPGTGLAEIFPELTPLEGEIIVHKTEPCSFTKTDLQDHLERVGKKKIVLAGYMVLQNIIPQVKSASDEIDRLITAYHQLRELARNLVTMSLLSVMLLEIGISPELLRSNW
jgi:hypothetical protein